MSANRVPPPGTPVLDEPWVRRALEHAEPNVLRLALYQATRDPELAEMRVAKTPFWGGAMQVATLAPEHASTVKEKAWRFLSAGTAAKPRGLAAEEVRQCMDLLLGEPVGDFAYGIGRCDLLDEEFPFAARWRSEPSDAVKQRFRVVIIGAGFGGLVAGIQLERLGIPYTIIERLEGVGGTWWTNDYPDARVDVASHHYQYSFMRNYPWKHYFATSAELREYAEAVARKFDLYRCIRFRTELREARWDEAGCCWRLTIRDAAGHTEELVANALISAAGIYSTPKMPDIPDIDSFAGRKFHSTAWDNSYDYAGKRVGQIGVGASGAQLMPAVARTAASLTVFQRSPQWVSKVDGYRASIGPEVQWLFDHFPGYWGWYSFFITALNSGNPHDLQNVDPEWQRAGGRVSERNDRVREHNRRYIEEKVGHDPELVRKLTPTFAPLTKRPIIDNGWFDALCQDNVELVTDPIVRITPRGVLTQSGREHEFDLLVFCSGFQVQEYLWPVQYIGRDGLTLQESWARDGARSYLGMTVSRFPNLFMLYGPNGQARSGGIIKWLEVWSHYAVASIVHLVETGAAAMDVKAQVFDDYNARLDEAMKLSIWYDTKDAGYYVNRHGRSQVNMPWLPDEYYRWVRAPDFADYELLRPTAGADQLR